MNISLIACVDENMGIGYNNQLLTHLPNDLSRFKRLTKHNIVIQGRKTYESIIKKNKQPLPSRTNVVLTRKKNYGVPNMVFTFNFFDDLLHILEGLDKIHKYNNTSFEVFVIGGKEVYELFLPFANKIYLTKVHHKFKKVDTHFPEFLHLDWKKVTAEFNQKDNSHIYDYTYITYEKE